MSTDHTWLTYLPSFIRKRVEGRQTLQKIVGNTAWLCADKLVRMGFGAVVGIWMARYLGPDRFGSLNFVLALVALFSTFSTLGLDSIVIRDVVRDSRCSDETLGSATALKFVGSLFSIALTIITILVLRPGEPTLFWVALIVSFCTFFQIIDTIDFWFQAHLSSKFTVYARNIGFLAASLVRVALILVSASLTAFATAALIEAVISAVGLVWLYHREGHRFTKWRISLGKMVYLVKESWPLIMQGIIIMIYMKIDQVMLGQMAGDRSVGEFSAATRLVEVWYFIPISITASLFPEIINSRNLAPEQYEKRIQNLYSLMIWMSTVMAVIITFCAPLIISVFYGEQYQNAAAVLSLQAWMATAIFFGVARQKWLTAEGCLKDGLYVEVSGMVINVAANLYLIPRHGAVGASLASLVTAFGANFVVAIFSRPIRKSMIMYGRSLLVPFCLVRGIRRVKFPS